MASLQIYPEYFNNDQFQPTPIDLGRGYAHDPTSLYQPFHSFNLLPAQDSISTTLSDVLEAEVKKQNDEINYYLKAQGEQMRQTLLERKRIELDLLFKHIEKRFVEYLVERDNQIGQIQKLNFELEEGLKAAMEQSKFWQKKAKCSESMVALLSNNLRDAIAGRLEGCGENGVEDDAASFDHERIIETKEEGVMNKNMKEESLKGHRYCRLCGSLDICILLLPCRHLCLCKNCYPHLHLCPICSSVKCACIEVYLS